MSKAEDTCEASIGVHVRDRGEPGAQERGVSSSSSRDQTLYLFARTGRQKEEWFQWFLSASRLKADLRKSSVAGGKSSEQSPPSSSCSSSALTESRDCYVFWLRLKVYNNIININIFLYG